VAICGVVGMQICILGGVVCKRCASSQICCYATLISLLIIY